jgi:hypothetical protein
MLRTIKLNGQHVVVWFDNGRILFPLWFWEC